MIGSRIDAFKGSHMAPITKVRMALHAIMQHQPAAKLSPARQRLNAPFSMSSAQRLNHREAAAAVALF